MLTLYDEKGRFQLSTINKQVILQLIKVIYVFNHYLYSATEKKASVFEINVLSVIPLSLCATFMMLPAYLRCLL
jgi:hypothetical protein